MEKPNKDQDNLSILISSCDKYSDLWKPFFNLFFKYWPDCPYKVYLGVNHEQFIHPKVQTILVGDDVDWSSSMKKMLENINSNYVLVILEDFFVREPVRTNVIHNALIKLIDLNGRFLLLRDIVGWPNKRLPCGFLFVDPQRPYRISLQPSIWRKNYLKELIVEGESPWEFEIYGSKRTSAYKEGFYCLGSRPYEWNHHVVERGMWFYPDAKYFEKLDIGCDFSKRKVMGKKPYIKWFFNKKKSVIINAILPWTVQLKMSKYKVIRILYQKFKMK